MEESNRIVKNYILKYGIILGIIWVMYSVICYITDNVSDKPWFFSVFELSIRSGVIMYGIYVYKSANNGFLKLRTALKVGIGIAFIGALIISVWDILLLDILEPEMINHRYEVHREEMIKNNPNISDEQIYQNLAAMSKKTIPSYIRSTIVLIWNLTLGFLISLIGGSIMHKREL